MSKNLLHCSGFPFSTQTALRCAGYETVGDLVSASTESLSKGAYYHSLLLENDVVIITRTWDLYRGRSRFNLCVSITEEGANEPVCGIAG